MTKDSKTKEMRIDIDISAVVLVAAANVMFGVPGKFDREGAQHIMSRFSALDEATRDKTQAMVGFVAGEFLSSLAGYLAHKGTDGTPFEVVTDVTGMMAVDMHDATAHLVELLRPAFMAGIQSLPDEPGKPH